MKLFYIYCSKEKIIFVKLIAQKFENDVNQFMESCELNLPNQLKVQGDQKHLNSTLNRNPCRGSTYIQVFKVHKKFSNKFFYSSKLVL